MGVWIIAIAAATYAITSLIEWINKIPESAKVKIEVDTDVFKALGKDLILINKFVNDYRKASKEHNVERMAELEEFGKKEFDLNEARLKQIIETTDGWKLAFKEYLKMAEDTYWNESIIKKKVEAQQTALTAKSTAISLFKSQSSNGFMNGKTAQAGISADTAGGWTWEQLYEASQKDSWAGKLDTDLRAIGIPQQIIDELRKAREANEIIKGLPQLRNVDLKTGIKSTVSTKSTPNVTLDKSRGLKAIKQEAEIVDRKPFSKPIVDSEIKYTNEELVIMEDNNKVRKGIYDDAIEYQIDYVKRREDARQQDLNNELAYQYGQKILIEAEVEKFDTVNAEYDSVIRDLNIYNKNKTNLLNTNALIEEEINKSKDQKSIEALNSQKQINLESIKLIEQDIAAKQTQKTTIETQLKEFEEYPNKIKQITESIAQLNVSITDSTRTQVEAERDLWQERVKMAKDYLDAISDVAGGMADIAQGNMDLISAEYDQQIWANDEMIQSDKQRENKAYEIEMQRWNALKENFEMQKKMKEAQAWMDFASGSVGIWTAPGITSLAPFGYILAGIQQAALLASTVGNVESIRAQQMLKPHKPGSGSSGGGGGGGINVALNPIKEALTSRDENINTMTSANLKEPSPNIVRVTDINDVQSKVKVREQNSTF